jgi:putative lipoic acid-binding regulatory protein
LVREHDNSTHYANLVKWVEWNRETSRAKQLHDEPAVYFSCMFGPYSIIGHASYEWLTTEIVEIVEKTDSELKFKTKNSTYTLYNHAELYYDSYEL